MRRKRGLGKQTFAISIIIFFAIVFLSGCVDTQNADNSPNNFIGVWTGSMKISSFVPMGGNSTLTQLAFRENVVAMTIADERGTYMMNSCVIG